MMYLCFSLSNVISWVFSFGPLPPTRHNPGRQINSHNPGRRERGAEHPTSHTDIKSEHVSQINISCRQVEHVKSCGGRRHLASHPNAVASYPYKSRPFAYPERCVLVLQQKWAQFHTQTQFSQNSNIHQVNLLKTSPGL